ncbi:(deoxy)nucleoside triphosphate pyrophosphohydrolase [Arcanobacterium bovis]|uniref:8-oxo-dGTP diphosphatase n=1 Tax=Arcanobacterium bovis TaxID=2529275 RepID=A0A4Q9V2B5_9ACTO|nr:(deoxy)nucleoside triphosphate pyrophosphohydrolase [Arcanobacterium bovis]TBW23728.1 (deoxy)nucleoside triphosphate pyrophosphohydrolase [Arcanobacterium bovis]
MDKTAYETPKKNIFVVGAVLMRNGKIFAAQRGPGRSLAGFWEFPGGKIEEGETPQQALTRELKEELQTDVIVGDQVLLVHHDYEFGTVHLDTYFCELTGAEPTLTEHSDVRWLAPSELNDVTWAPADVPVIGRLRELLGKCKDR